MAKLVWEEVEHNCSGYMMRAKVPGGWLVRLDEVPFHAGALERYGDGYGHDLHPTITFVPDSTHSWQ